MKAVCTCEFSYDDSEIHFCPLHLAAEAMLEALKRNAQQFEEIMAQLQLYLHQTGLTETAKKWVCGEIQAMVTPCELGTRAAISGAEAAEQKENG